MPFVFKKPINGVAINSQELGDFRQSKDLAEGIHRALLTKKGQKMKAMIIPLLAAALSAGSMALAQTDQVIPTPISAHEVPNAPSAMATPPTIPGGLYRLANGF